MMPNNPKEGVRIMESQLSEQQCQQCLAWGYVELKVYTHKIDGLTRNDFIFAAKVDEALQEGNREP
jgi:pterin-4a-carbinolamine dehydratase